ncbi:MAG: FAD-dependent oxidoreductase [Gemmatimonadetes bacterium]|nr:FAD-dependent oxidoreductase [Gemmatimonadota bacterium]
MSNPFAILLEPVRIGPVTSPNRFYQVPHCNGMGWRMPEALAAMRGVKAEGGWGVVCTEEVEIHHTSDLSPYFEGRLWEREDSPALARMVEAVHAHGSLAAIELVHSGANAVNLYSRATSLAPRSMSVLGGSGYEPTQARAMTKQDFRDVRRWHRAAALRARDIGFDIVYCYAGHMLTLPMQLLSRRFNDRHDEYGGSLENRVRLLRELIEETREAVGARCGIAVRLAVDELIGQDGLTSDGEGRDVVEMLAELPDLWDVNISGWSNDSATSRFTKEGYQEQYCGFVKSVTSKPVVGVGRYTTPDAMVSAVRRGVLDLIGAARPSIADPFLPAKIRDGRWDEIRECIGCNICVSADFKLVPIRCTQNPTMGEEWRRGWHPERIAARTSDEQVLVIGGGPAGLECARALGQRGYQVVLAERRDEMGGRVAREARLPGLTEYRRVVDWRLDRIRALPNVALYPGSEVSVDDVLEFGAPHVIVATGCTWRRDGIGRNQWRPIPGVERAAVFTPDDILDGRLPTGRVLIYDNDGFYLGGVIAERLAHAGCTVTLVTPAPLVSYWTQYTLEQERVQARLRALGVRMHTQRTLLALDVGSARFADALRIEEVEDEHDAVVLLTDRMPSDALYTSLCPLVEDGRLTTLRCIGDAEAPGIIAQAVFAGHLAAREFGTVPTGDTPFRVERWPGGVGATPFESR